MTQTIGDFQMLTDFSFWIGKVVGIDDPEKLGRVQVRLHGFHADDEEKISNEDLYWASVMMPVTDSGSSGIGNAPCGLVKGADVAGIFLDGKANQVPLVMGTILGKPKKPKEDSKTAFKDPDGVYPRYEDEESDVNRLARNENVDKTIVKTKKDNLEKKIAIAGGDKTWDEPETKFEPKYPMNRVMETESGHVQEFDDTEGKERIHQYHKAGTFYEIYPDGQKVEKIQKDNYQVILGAEFVYIKGNASVTIDGNSHVLVKGDCILETKGNKTETIKGNYNLSIDGDYSLNVKGSQTSNTKGLEKRKADKIHLN